MYHLHDDMERCVWSPAIARTLSSKEDIPIVSSSTNNKDAGPLGVSGKDALNAMNGLTKPTNEKPPTNNPLPPSTSGMQHGGRSTSADQHGEAPQDVPVLFLESDGYYDLLSEKIGGTFDVVAQWGGRNVVFCQKVVHDVLMSSSGLREARHEVRSVRSAGLGTLELEGDSSPSSPQSAGAGADNASLGDQHHVSVVTNSSGTAAVAPGGSGTAGPSTGTSSRLSDVLPMKAHRWHCRLDDSGEVEDLTLAPSEYMNSGAYGFQSLWRLKSTLADLVRELNDRDNSSGGGGAEFARTRAPQPSMSLVAKRMIRESRIMGSDMSEEAQLYGLASGSDTRPGGKNHFRACVHHAEMYVSLTTPLALRIFYNNMPRISMKAGSLQEAMAPRRICFDLDNTLVTYPAVPGGGLFFATEAAVRRRLRADLARGLARRRVNDRTRRRTSNGGTNESIVLLYVVNYYPRGTRGARLVLDLMMVIMMLQKRIWICSSFPDYSTVEPIPWNIRFAQYLKRLGNTIIIHTSRTQELSAKGGGPGLGPGAAMAKSVGVVTFETLAKFEILTPSAV